jgi:hypothetical protein
VSKVPRATRYLLVTCADHADGQFRGVRQACGLLARERGVLHVAWPAARLELGAEPALIWAAVSGHGAPTSARIGDGSGIGLGPQDLFPMPGGDLYLLACHQGVEPIRAAWREATGAVVHACPGETESALSALFLLALVEHGPGSASHWFDRWLEANERLRPHFPEMRRLYEEQDRDFTAAVRSIAAVVDLGPFRDILAVAARHEEALSHLG